MLSGRLLLGIRAHGPRCAWFPAGFSASVQEHQELGHDPFNPLVDIEHFGDPTVVSVQSGYDRQAQMP
jgi:hypothetical protein